jgi:hypothetical protein
MVESKCKSCRENVKVNAQISQDQINEAIEKLARNKRIKFVSDEVYELRLLKCSKCKYLDSKGICLQCGCYVQIRAKLADASCSLSKQNEW